MYSLDDIRNQIEIVDGEPKAFKGFLITLVKVMEGMPEDMPLDVCIAMAFDEDVIAAVGERLQMERLAIADYIKRQESIQDMVNDLDFDDLDFDDLD